ncbi:hypothetical protein [Pseudomonas mosselii]|uniref:hypothetical protein n=1 Tax=Pseudomonas mosselii TaxID=78327 RepID=UPI000BB4D32B|nr:hypothetical protein [Pseudomonas mosselii]ATB67720.1 hypothetical protein CLJ08_25145 [Pseudomonas mosselii]
MLARKRLLFLIIGGLVGCGPYTSSVQPDRPVAQTQILISETDKPQQLIELNKRGEQAIAQLKVWYNSTTEDCGGPDKPSYLCSGIEMRATGTDPDVFSWDPSPKHTDKGAIAFSWVRRDSNFASPAERYNGFLFPPLQAIPEGKIRDLQVLCTFPTDGGTDNRETAQGCGPQRNFESTTDACQKIGVNSAEQWLEKYSADDIRRARFCGWDLREEPAGMRAQWFEMPIKVRAGLSASAWAGYNEILLPVWKVGVGADLPLYAFFYVEGQTRAGLLAQFDQVRYHTAYGQAVPVIRIKFPTAKDQVMQFTYDEGDQAVGRPIVTSNVDFESEQTGERKEFKVDGSTFILHGTGEVSDDSHGGGGSKISGKHLEFEGPTDILLPGNGRRRVSYDWGCSDICTRDLSLTENHRLLNDREGMHYGSDELTVDGPEILHLYMVEDVENPRMVIDNLKVTHAQER